MGTPTNERPLITEENSQFLSNLKLEDAEQFLMTRFGNANNEIGLIYDKVNEKPIRVITSQGQGTSVNLSKELFEGLERDGYDISKLTFTHNHPEGNPLTQSDVMSAIEHNMKEIRAVGKFGKFGLKRKEGSDVWLSDEQLDQLKARKVKQMEESRGKPLRPREIEKLNIDKTDVVNVSDDMARQDMERTTLKGEALNSRTLVSHSIEQELNQFICLEKMEGMSNSKFTFEPNPSYVRKDKQGRRVQVNRRKEVQTEYDKTYGKDKPVKGKKRVMDI